MTKKKSEVINAFHPDYVKTYHPNLMDDFRTLNKNKQRSDSLTNHVEKMRETVPSHGTVFGVSETSVSISPKQMMKRPKLERTEFHIFNKAGMPKKGKK